MSFGFNFGNAPQRVLPQVIEALQRLQENPNRLDRDREERYDDPPPPYSESGETTQPPTPVPAVEEDDEVRERYLRRQARSKSIANVQFKSQAKRERERLSHQLTNKPFGRRQTLPWDDSYNFVALSENNVRSRWVEQGIWGDEWGPAWSRNSSPSMVWEGGGNGPFSGAYNPATSEAKPGVRWGHEEGNSPEPSPEPEPRRPLGPWIWFEGPPKPKPPRRKRNEYPVGARVPVPRPTVRNPEASRPMPQFLYQISKEREWIKDEIDYVTPGRIVDLDALAHEGVKKNWIKDGIWNPRWGDDDLPGPSWLHEETDPVLFTNDGGGQLPDVTVEDASGGGDGGEGDDEQHATDGDNDNTPNQTISGAQALRKQRRTGRQTRMRAAELDETQEEDRGEEALRRRSRRIARSTETEEENQDRRPPKRRHGSGHDAVVSEQPQPKRARASGRLRHNDTHSTTTGGPRRSSRIGERERQRKAAVTAETQLQLSRPQPRKTSKSGKSGKRGRSTGKG